MLKIQKKYYLLLIIIIIIIAGLLYLQIRRAGSIVTSFSTAPILSADATFIPTYPADPKLGNPGAPIIIIEFADLSCPQCQKDNYILTKFVNEHPTEMQLIWKDAPRLHLFAHSNILAHQAAVCAHKQNQFWKFIEIAMTEKKFSRADLQKIAEGLKLNLANWNKCLDSEESKAPLAAGMGLAKTLGIQNLPAIYINSKLINLTPDLNLEELLTRSITKE